MTINLCLVGLGSAGYQHIEALQNVIEINVTSYFDTDSSKSIDGLKRMQNWTEMLKDDSINVVALCTPPGQRFKLIKDVLTSGKSVLIEKPPFTCVDELVKTMELTTKYKATAGVMFQHRYQLPTELDEFLINGNTTAILEISRPRERARYFKDWRVNPNESFGGITAHLGVHYLDLALQIMGKPRKVFTIDKTEVSTGIDNKVLGAIEFMNGSSLIFTITSEALHRSERLKIFSENGTFTIQNGQVIINEDGKETSFEKKNPIQLRSLLYEDFSDAVINKKQPKICNLERSEYITQVLEAIYTNNETIGGVTIV